MLGPGDRVPDVVTVGQELEPVPLAGLTADGPVLLTFYLYDWTGT